MPELVRLVAVGLLVSFACTHASALAVAKGGRRNFFATLVDDFKQGLPEDKLGFIKRCDASLGDLLPELREEYTEGQVPQVLVHSCEAFGTTDDFNRGGETRGIARARTRCQYFARELGTEYAGKRRYQKWCESVWNFLASEELSPEAARAQMKEAEAIRSELDAAKQELRAVKAQHRIEVVMSGGGRDAFKKAVKPWGPPDSSSSGNSDRVISGKGEDGGPDQKPFEETEAELASHEEGGDESLCCPDECDVCADFEVVGGVVRKDYGNVRDQQTSAKGDLKLPAADPNATHVSKRVRQLANKLKKQGQQGHEHKQKKKRKSTVARRKEAATTVAANSSSRAHSATRARTPAEVNRRTKELHRRLRKSPSSTGSGKLPLPFANANKNTEEQELPDVPKLKAEPVDGMDEMMNRSQSISDRLHGKKGVAGHALSAKTEAASSADDKSSSAGGGESEDDRYDAAPPAREVTSEEVDEKVPEMLRKVDDPPPGREKKHQVPYGGALKKDHSELDDMVAETSKRISKVVQKNLRVQDHDLALDDAIEKKVADILHKLVEKDGSLHLQAAAVKAVQAKEDEADEDDDEEADEEEDDESDNDDHEEDSGSLVQENAKRTRALDIYHVLIKEFERTDVFPSHIKTKPFLDRCTDIIGGLMPKLQEEYTWPQVPSILLHECDVYRSAQDFKTEGKRMTHAVDSCRFFATRLANQFKGKQDYKAWCSNVYAQLLRDSGKEDLTDKQKALLKHRPDFKESIFDSKKFRHHGRKGAANGCCPANCKMCML